MSRTYGSGISDQQGLPPLSVQDRLTGNDRAYLILDTVNGLNIPAITTNYEQEERGLPTCPARMTVDYLWRIRR
jgi:hypothetical protein